MVGPSSLFHCRYRFIGARRPSTDRGADRPRAVRAGAAARPPVPAADECRGRTVARRVATTSGALAVGSAVGHHVVPLPGRGANRVGVAADRRAHRSRLRRGQPGIPVRGPRSRAHGEPLQGIHPRRTAVPVTGPGPVEVVIEAASNPTFPQFRPSPLGSPATAGESPLYEFTRADLVVVDEEAEALLHDYDVLDGVMRTLAATDRRRPQLLGVLARASTPSPAVPHPPRSAPFSPRRWRRRPSSVRPPRHRHRVTPTSTRRGYGRSARPCASVCARSPRQSR